jgi:hypothetical protein
MYGKKACIYAMQAPYIKMARLAKAMVLKALVLKAINVWKKACIYAKHIIL